ncbi:LOW QUALITY PROTEIN: zinc finger protein weckle [Drosophila gunungcola]|uniref:LOW QUALITY PROTEIN: zinc finger protein weckle n=1 Tax=Drosophila gunungcola TaxID=103775 RepID=UPI0022E50A99|nr:LOW QUALITY PROTEIN: zinc finger protein weckle [Drosophila gunungcola]
MTECHWLNWCRLCAKDDARGNVKVQMSGNSQAWDNVLIMAIRKYFEVEMRLEDELSSVLCTECYTLISELIDFAEHVTKVQAIFEVLRRTASEPDKHLDVAALRQQYGLCEDDWTHIIKPMQAPENESEIQQKPDSVLQESPIGVEAASTQLELRESQPYLFQTKNSLQIGIPKQEFIDIGPILSEKSKSRLDTDEVLVELHEDELSQCRVDSTVSPDFQEQDIKPELLDSYDDDAEFLPEKSQQMQLVIVATPQYAPETIAEEKAKRGRMNCEKCGKGYRNRASYEKHLERECRRIERRVKVDKATTTCDLCNKTLSSTTALKLHKEGIHQNVKPYICDSCGKQLKTITALNEHKLVHTDSRPFECSVCKAGFKNRARLKAHHQIHAEPSFVCNICGKKLQTRRTWNMHKLVHSEERRLKCDVCGALFKRSKTLKTHLLSHTGLRPYVCNYCGKSFACNANCRSHKLKKHPQEVQQEDGAKLPSRLNVPTLEELRVMTQKLPKGTD